MNTTHQLSVATAMIDAQQPNREQLNFRSRFQLVLKQFYIGFVVNVGVAIAVTYVLWLQTDQTLLLAWCGVVVVTSLVRVLLVKQTLAVFDKLDTVRLTQRYRCYFISVIASGAIWGLLGSILFPFNSIIYQGFVMVVMAAMLSGAVAIMYPLSRLYYAFSIPMLLPVLVSLYLQGTQIQVSVALLAAMYLVAMMLIAVRAEDALIRLFNTQYDNIELLRKLEIMSNNLGDARDQLEARVAQRTLQLSRMNENLNTEIEERKRVEEELFNQKELAEITLRSIAEGIVTTEESGRIVYINEKAELLLDQNLNEVYQKYFHDAVNLIDEETGEVAADKIPLVLRDKHAVVDPTPYLIPNHAKKGTAVRLSIAPIFNKQKELIGLVIVLHDVTRERLHQLQLSHIATHDSLTGLYNRYAFEQQLNKLELKQDARSDKTAIVYIDLDHFKIVNDSCGHLAGDQLLKQLSELLVTHLDAKDVIARIGGDEFGAILHASNKMQIIARAEKLLKAIRSFRFLWLDRTFSVGASLGLVFPDRNIPKIQECLRFADMACFVAKEKGGKRIHIYADEDEALLAKHNELNQISQLSDALEKNGLVLYKQEILRIDGNETDKHYEVLLRVRNSRGEIVLPSVFINAAERYHFMHEVDRWVIDKVFELVNNRYLLNSALPVKLNINLSGLSLTNDRMLEFIIDKLQESAIPGSFFCFEITETTAITNFTKAISFIEQLKKYNCEFAIDDFGIGVSSLGYLKNLPVDYVKIDGSFIRDIDNDKIDYAMVESIHKVVSLSGKKTIAEYVESTEILDILRRMGVEYAQGHAIAKPSILMDETIPQYSASVS